MGELNEFKTDVLIVGTGPAGASLACFLASHGIHGLMIGKTPGSITTPRAHITNPGALECLRDIGLENECLRHATNKNNMEHTSWCYSMAGEEFGRLYSWGNAPARMGDVAASSPCTHVDLPQTELEPILVKYATQTGFQCRFDTELVNFVQKDDLVIATVFDNISGSEYKIKAKYLAGCDGGRSKIVQDLDLPLEKKPGGGTALNVLLRADLSKHMGFRTSNLNWVFQPDVEFPDWGWICVVRMVKPWYEWLFVFFPIPGKENIAKPSPEQCQRRLQQIIGDEGINIEIRNMGQWQINDVVAEYYSKGNVFCLGDAVHRHPPTNGLGSNTCIQDAFNLAWKMSYVLKGIADKSILDTYTLERQPVGKTVVERANQALRDHGPIFKILGMLKPTREERIKAYQTLQEATPEGLAARETLQKGIETSAHEYQAIGVEMNQRYESTAIFAQDENTRPPLPEDPVLYREITTYPGSRLPHAWLNTRIPSKPISTTDLAGNGRFTLFTGTGGHIWKTYAEKVSSELQIDIACYSVGRCQDYEDMYFDWSRRREIDEDGCVVVRPDCFVAWRCNALKEGSEDKLKRVMSSILGKG